MQRDCLIIDKNVLHGAGGELHSQLRARYRVVQARCLFHELLNNVAEGKEDEAGKNARKLEAGIEVHETWTALVERSLRGTAVPMDGTPVVEGGTSGYDQASGEELKMYVHTPEGPLSVYEYKARQIARGQLSSAALSASAAPRPLWSRASVSGRLLDRLPPGGAFSSKGPSAERAVVAATEALLETPALQRTIIHWVIDALHLPLPQQARLRRSVIKERWRHSGRSLLRDFAPYAHFSARVRLLYAVGYDVWPKGRDANDRADLEYLMHLPFCRRFASDDRMVRAMAVHLLRPDQAFVTTDQLKQERHGG